jgi:hypothetical protein
MNETLSELKEKEKEKLFKIVHTEQQFVVPL